MSKVINFSELKRKEIRKEFDNGIVVYNPNPEQKKEIMELITKSIDEKSQDIEISGRDIMLQLIPMLTNIHLDLEDNEELLNEILEDPSDELLEVVDELNDIIKFVGNRMIKNIQNLAELPKEELEKLLPKEEIDPKQKEIEELKAKLAELEGK